MAERQVVFYACRDIEGKPAFDPVAALEPINELEDDDWRVPDGDSDLAVIVDKIGSKTTPSRLRLLRIRSDAPSKLTALRELTPVEVAENEAITEFTWAMLWPDGFLAGVSSRDAPPHKRLATYFRETSGQETHIVNLFQPDILDKLKELREHGLRRVQLKLSNSEAKQLEEDEGAKGFHNILKANRASKAATIGIDLSVGRSGAKAILSNKIGKSAVVVAEDFIDGVESMHIRGYDKNGTVRELNMKQERIRWSIDDGEGVAKAVYKEIRRARKEVEGDIKSLKRAALGN